MLSLCLINGPNSIIPITNKNKIGQATELSEKIKGYNIKSQTFKQIMKFTHVSVIFNAFSNI